MASPRPIPTALKVARGNPGRRPLNKNEPKPSLDLPPCPDWLTEVGKKAWQTLVPELSRLGVMTSIDVGAFARYCDNVARWWECREFLKVHGPDLVVKNEETGEVAGIVPYPHGKRLREIELMLLKQEESFGLNPSARSKLNAAPADQGDELDQLLGNTLRIAK